MRRTKTQPIGEILSEFFQRPFVAAKLAEGHLPDYWRMVAGDHVANLTTDINYVNKVLYIRMASSVLRQEVFYRRDEYAQRINELAGIQLVNVIIIR